MVAVDGNQEAPARSRRARLMFVTLWAARLERTLLPVFDALDEWLASWRAEPVNKNETRGS
jgi:hypothetical protein